MERTNDEQQRDRERDDSVRVPLTEFTRQIAQDAGRAAANEVLENHLKTCPALKIVPKFEQDTKELDDRVRKLEIRLATLIGFMLGSGVLGGVAGGSLVSFLGG